MGFTGWNRSKEVCAMPLNTLESNHKLGSAEVQSAPSPWINKLPVRAGRMSSPRSDLLVCPANERFPERRRRDSNPRYPVERYNTLAGCRLQPLGHSSGSQEYIRDVCVFVRWPLIFVYSSLSTLLCWWSLRR